jgi:pimeloyl-ACP methyl ester carboxylesterase
MGNYVDIGGLRTWYDARGAGDPLVLLHGGLCTNDTWAAQFAEFAGQYHVLAPERRAHGHTPDVDGPLSYADMATDTICFLETVVGGPAHLVGWSDGGIVGLLVAIRRPDLVTKLVVISANYSATGAPGVEQMAREMTPDAPDMDMFRAPYEAATPDGVEHWPVVVAKIFEMFVTMPDIARADLGRITAPALVMAGDNDIITLEHTGELHRAIPGSQLAIVPGTSHALVMEKPGLVNRIVLDFLGTHRVATVFGRVPEAARHG